MYELANGFGGDIYGRCRVPVFDRIMWHVYKIYTLWQSRTNIVIYNTAQVYVICYEYT